MNTQKYTGVGIGMLLLVNFPVFAEDAYEPAEYKPTVDYVVIAPAKKSGEQAPTSASRIRSQAPSTPVKPADMDAGAVASAQAASVPGQESNKSIGNILLLATLATAGFFLLRKKHLSKQGAPTDTVLSAADSMTATGVERYLEKMNPRKTGVDKYLEKHAATAPVTGVSKYLAKQAVRERL